MITGIGIDLVDIPRVREMLKRHGDRFTERTFTLGEREYCDSCADPAIHYAARFAAKEAAAKALGTGLWSAAGVNWTDVEVTRDTQTGRPSLLLHGMAAELAAGMKAHISLTHTDSQAAAQVILERS